MKSTPEEHAEERAAPTHEGDAAEEDGGEDGELQVDADGERGGVELRGDNQPTQRCRQTGSAVEEEWDALGRHAEGVRGDAIGADCGDVAAERALVPGVAAEEEDGAEEPDWGVDPQELAVAEPGEAHPEPVLREAFAEDLRHASRAGEAAQGDDDWREAEIGDEVAGRQSPAEPDQEGNRGRQHDVRTHGGELAEDN